MPDCELQKRCAGIYNLTSVKAGSDNAGSDRLIERLALTRDIIETRSSTAQAWNLGAEEEGGV